MFSRKEDSSPVTPGETMGLKALAFWASFCAGARLVLAPQGLSLRNGSPLGVSSTRLHSVL